MVQGRYKPVAEFALYTVICGGADQVVFVINETKAQFIAWMGDGARYNTPFVYVYQPIQTRDAHKSGGLAAALDAAYSVTRDALVMFAMPDTILKPVGLFLEMAEMLPAADVVFAAFEVAHPEYFGILQMDAAGHVAGVVDKPTTPMGGLVWGAIMWQPSFTEFIHAERQAGVDRFNDILNDGIQAGIPMRACAFTDGGVFMDVGTPESIEELMTRGLP
jgi:glucose-1-phosphate thymidylyltransferase